MRIIDYLYDRGVVNSRVLNYSKPLKLWDEKYIKFAQNYVMKMAGKKEIPEFYIDYFDKILVGGISHDKKKEILTIICERLL